MGDVWGVATAVNPVPVSSFGVEYEPGQKPNAFKFGDNPFVIGGSPDPNPPVAEVTGVTQTRGSMERGN